jgi:hypothetical protein
MGIGGEVTKEGHDAVVAKHSKILFVAGDVCNGGADAGLDGHVRRPQQAHHQLEAPHKRPHLSSARGSGGSWGMG